MCLFRSIPGQSSQSPQDLIWDAFILWQFALWQEQLQKENPGGAFDGEDEEAELIN